MTKMGDHNNDSRATRTVQVLVRSKLVLAPEWLTGKSLRIRQDLWGNPGWSGEQAGVVEKATVCMVVGANGSCTRTDYCGTTDGTRVRFGLVYFIFSLTWLTRVVIDGSGTSMY
jgi:hypothetical protein